MYIGQSAVIRVQNIDFLHDTHFAVANTVATEWYIVYAKEIRDDG